MLERFAITQLDTSDRARCATCEGKLLAVRTGNFQTPGMQPGQNVASGIHARGIQADLAA